MASNVVHGDPIGLIPMRTGALRAALRVRRVWRNVQPHLAGGAPKAGRDGA